MLRDFLHGPSSRIANQRPTDIVLEEGTIVESSPSNINQKREFLGTGLYGTPKGECYNQTEQLFVCVPSHYLDIGWQ